LLNQVTEHRAKIAALTRQQAQKEAEHATTSATIRKLETTIPVVQQRVDIRKTLMDKELGSKLTYFEILQLLLEQQAELGVQKSHLQEAEAAVAAIHETRRQAEAEYRRTVSDELAKAEQKANGLAQDLIKAEQKSEPKGQELNYNARISLDRTQMQVEDRMVNLSPGMAVTVEIKTGSRTMLNYLLSPLLRYRNDTLRER
jgi:formylmethanofuran dehydrogenase subunit E-like metal-binding protein